MILPAEVIADIRELGTEEGARIVRPGQSKVWREGGQVMAELLP